MKKILPLMLMTVLSCSKATKVTEKSKESQFNFGVKPSDKVSLKIQNIGNVTVKSSVPDKIVAMITKSATSQNRSKAAELVDAIIFTPVRSAEAITYKPGFPAISSSEKVSTDVTFLLPLNQHFPVSVATVNGKLHIGGIRGNVNALLKGTCPVFIKTFTGRLELNSEGGDMSIGYKITGGSIKSNSGNILLTQRLKNMDEDLIISSTSGDVSLELINNPEFSLELDGKKGIENKSATIKLSGNNYKGKGKYRIVVKTGGKIILRPDLF
ncbi:hypothetical protein KKF34_05750 [Myxococcota bacterium]|nr:hypothetical protein [Myxococcota bacterium]MBU1380252.1 hypothetical protein [Myxococcota bacterium]MBU1496366.1 hypothetical protein [Myxococcota bacterium]